MSEELFALRDNEEKRRWRCVKRGGENDGGEETEEIMEWEREGDEVGDDWSNTMADVRCWKRSVCNN